ncbi:Nucleotidyltransferase substrate binding protein [Candidatus Magnetobacterium bavaricum]|uniref:Nucleotidyltransferase substrate binding protein n=1 Tax=Candidatus Magnetobacterium bavaricum TaxID=29290 RepID=A0A0F3GNU1_9BACT|nr:Nucleotidyltransferase substrate binding protein [Candidatus Magnetobacterium bavaricum]
MSEIKNKPANSRYFPGRLAMPLNTEHLNRCIQTLELSLESLRKSEPGSIEYEVFRNATIKGFELTLEVSGKLLRKVLKPFFATPKTVDALVFKDLFRYAARHGICSTDEVQRWLKYRDNRNNTAHDYGAGFAEETLLLLPDLIADARSLMNKLGNVAGN